MPCCCVVLAWVCWRAIWDAQVKCRGIQKGGFRYFWEVKELTSGVQQDTSYSWLHFPGDCYKNISFLSISYYFLLSLNIDMNVIDSHIHFVVVTYLMDLSSRSLIFSSLLNSIGYKEVNVFSRNVNKLPVIIALYWYRLQHSWRGALHLYV